MQFSRIARRMRALIAVAAILLPARAPLAGAAPEQPQASLAKMARLSLAAAIEVMDRCSFQYRSVANIGSLPLEQALASVETLLDSPTTASFVDSWAVARWESVIRTARGAWSDKSPLETREFVRSVRRYGNTLLDEDEDLPGYKLVRPTAGSTRSSPDLNVHWFPLNRQVLFETGDIDPGKRPGARYFLFPSALSLASMHAPGQVAITDQSEVQANITLTRGNASFRYSVHRSVRWLPRRVDTIQDGKVVRASVFQWSDVPGVGPFLAGVARVDSSDGKATLSLACFRNPTLKQEPLRVLSIPPGTRVVDERAKPAKIKSIESDGDLEEDCGRYVRIGGPLEVPSFADIAASERAPSPTVKGR